MIRKLLVLSILFISSTYGSSNWKKVTEATFHPLNGVFFLNENLGWVAGSSGTILRTTDGGETWLEPDQDIEVTSTMYSVFFVNENIGYAGGYNDLIFKSTDGGKTWTKLSLSSVGGNVRSIYFADENKGWILSGTSGGGQILYTSDGGDNWTAQVTESSINLRAMDFSSPNHGICLGGKKGNFAIYYTTDGTNWSKAPVPSGIPPVYSRTDLYAVSMVNDSIACATGWGSSAVGLQPAFTLRTVDGGANWTYETQAEENRLYNNMYGMEFSGNIGIAVGGSSYKGTVAYRTEDAGVSWEEIYLPMGFTGYDISITNNKICVVGSGGGIVISNDGGNTWELKTKVVNSTLFSILETGPAIADIFPNGTASQSSRIVAAGFYGGFLYSNDGGASWNSSFVAGAKACPTVEDIFFLDNEIGYAAQRNRMISKTTDGGVTWTQIMKDTMVTSINNTGVQFLDENIGFVVGKYGSDVSAFYKTVDGGNSWSSLIADANLPNELNDLYFFDENNGVVCGDQSVLAYTENGGDSWTKVQITNIPENSFDLDVLKFYDNNLGLAAGKYLAKTLDGGKTWEYVEIQNLPKEIKGIAFVNDKEWYITGSKFLFKTTDGGQTWNDVIDLNVVTATTNYDVMVDNGGYPWIACGSSEIYTVANISDVTLKSDNIANDFTLQQNFPNPFNPSTIISYSIPESDFVTLKIFNLLGQEVATLVNESQKSGTYQVEFDASRITSGIYIYTLQNGKNSISRKMVLVK